VSAGRKQNLRRRSGAFGVCARERSVAGALADGRTPRRGRIFLHSRRWRAARGVRFAGRGARGVDDGDVESRRARRHPLETHFERKVHDTGSLMVPSKRAASPEGKNAIHVVNAKSAAASHDTRSPARLEALRALRMAPRGSSGAFAIPRSSLCSRAPESADSPAPPTHRTAKGPTAMMTPVENSRKVAQSRCLRKST